MVDNTKKNYIWNSIGSGLLSFNSLIFLIIVTRINGIEEAGVFSFCYAFACIINAFALFYGRTFQVTDNNRVISESTFLVTRFLASLVGMSISIVFVLLNGYDRYKAIVFLLLCILKCEEAISDGYYGVLQKRNKLFIVGKSMTYKSLLGFIGFLFIDFFSHSVIISCLYLVGLNLLFIKIYDISCAKREASIYYKIHYGEILQLIKKSCFTFGVTMIILALVNIPRYIVDIFLSSKEQAIYGFISMPATFVMLLGQFVLQPALITLATAFEQHEKKCFQKEVTKLIVIILSTMIIVLPVAYLMGIPVLEIIYAVQLEEYRTDLLIVIIGATFYAASNVFFNALITLRSTKRQMILQMVNLIIGTVITVVLVYKYGLKGGILSYGLIFVLQFFSYLKLYKMEMEKRFGDRRI